MAKKKKSSGKKKSKGLLGGINTSSLIGKAGGVFATKKFINTFLTDTVKITDPKMKAIALIAIGEFAPTLDMVKGMLKDDAILMGAGSAISTLGIADLMTEMGFAGMGAVSDNDALAVVLEGIDDVDMDEDILGDDDLNVVNEDVLGDDDLNVVNEDILGDDDDDF